MSKPGSLGSLCCSTGRCLPPDTTPDPDNTTISLLPQEDLGVGVPPQERRGDPWSFAFLCRGGCSYVSHMNCRRPGRTPTHTPAGGPHGTCLRAGTTSFGNGFPRSSRGNAGLDTLYRLGAFINCFILATSHLLGAEKSHHIVCSMPLTRPGGPLSDWSADACASPSRSAAGGPVPRPPPVTARPGRPSRTEC